MSIDWNAFEEKRVLAPWIPQLTCDTDTCNFNTKYTYSEVDPSSPTVCFLIQHRCSRIHQILICLCLKTFTTIVIMIQGKRIKCSISVIYVLFKIDPFIASCFLRFPDYMNICYGIFMNIYDFFDVEMESKKNN